jgi:translocator protein
MTLAGLLILVVGGGLLIGLFNTPGPWYAQLEKPSFNPPNWLFAPVWTTLYVMIAVAGWKTWDEPRTRLAMSLWAIQLGLNFLWSPTFFTAHRLDVALAIIVALLATIIAFIVVSWKQQRTAALLFIPYAAWVGFATLLNAALLSLNPAAGPVSP